MAIPMPTRPMPTMALVYLSDLPSWQVCAAAPLAGLSFFVTKRGRAGPWGAPGRSRDLSGAFSAPGSAVGSTRRGVCARDASGAPVWGPVGRETSLYGLHFLGLSR